MKTIILTVIMLLTFAMANAQIGEVKVNDYDNKMTAYDNNGSNIGSYTPHQSTKLAGYSSELIVLADGSKFSIYDKNFKLITSNSFHSGTTFLRVSGSYIYLKEGGNEKKYDKNLRLQ